MIKVLSLDEHLLLLAFVGRGKGIRSLGFLFTSWRPARGGKVTVPHSFLLKPFLSMENTEKQLELFSKEHGLERKSPFHLAPFQWNNKKLRIFQGCPTTNTSLMRSGWESPFCPLAGQKSFFLPVFLDK